MYDRAPGLRRVVLESHAVLAWLEQHSAATINWYRVGTDGKTAIPRMRLTRLPESGCALMWVSAGMTRAESRPAVRGSSWDCLATGRLEAGGATKLVPEETWSGS